MYNAGDFDTTETVHIPVNSFSSDDPTASVTMTNLAAGDIEIHKDGSATQRASDNGVTVDIDFDSITGNHMINIDLSDNTDAGFYSAGSRYLVRIEGVTVDGGTLNAWVGGFSIGCTLRPTTDGRTLDVEAGGCAGIDWANVANPTTAVDLSGTDIKLVDTCTTNTDMRGTDSAATAAALATHDGKLDTVDGIVDAILVDTAEIGAAGAGLTEAGGTGDQLTAVPWNANWDAEVQSECADALTAYDPPTKAELDTAVANVSVDEIQASALADLFNTDSGTTYAAAVSGSVVKETADNAGGSALTEAGIADAVWDEAQSGHVGAGTMGLALGSTYSTIVVRVAQCGDAGGVMTIDLDAGASAVNDFYKGQLIAIVLGTGAGQARTCVGYDGATKIATVTPSWATNPDGDSYFAVLNTGSTVVVDWADGGRLDLIIDAILADTNELQVDDTPGALAAIDAKIDIIDTTADAILVDTGTTLPEEHAALPTAAENRAEMDSNSTQLAAIVADTNELQTDITNGGRVDLILDELTYQGDTNEGKLDTIDTVVDAVLADTDALQAALLSAFAEVTAKPAAGAALAGKIAFLFHAAVQKATFNGGTGVHTLYQSNGSSTLATRTLTDDGTTQTSGAMS
jgi:hypothetical protein